MNYDDPKAVTAWAADVTEGDTVRLLPTPEEADELIEAGKNVPST